MLTSLVVTNLFFFSELSGNEASQVVGMYRHMKNDGGTFDQSLPFYAPYFVYKTKVQMLSSV